MFIRVAQAFIRTDYISYNLLKFFYFGETCLLFAVENNNFVDAYGIPAGCFTGPQAYTVQLITKRSKQLLGHVGGAQHPVALWAVFYVYSMFHCV